MSNGVQVGQKYGRMEVKGLFPSKVGKVTRVMALCVCECGTEKTIRADGLKRGTRSCGCLNRETAKAKITKNNKETAVYQSFSSNHPRVFRAWASMRARCYYPSQKCYEKYGGAGVRVCSHLLECPDNLKNLIGDIPGEGFTLDRFPIHNGNYTCGQCEECKKQGWEKNVRWATRLEQSLNRGGFNVHLTAFGKTLTMSQWRDLSGIHDETIRKRLARGWSSEDVVSKPDKFGNCYKPE